MASELVNQRTEFLDTESRDPDHRVCVRKMNTEGPHLITKTAVECSYRNPGTLNHSLGNHRESYGRCYIDFKARVEEEHSKANIE